MKIKVLTYTRHKSGRIRVQSHNRCKGKWKPNPNYDLHKMLINNAYAYPVITKNEENIEVK